MARAYDMRGVTSVALRAILDPPPPPPPRWYRRWWISITRVFRGNSTRVTSGKTFAA